MAILISDEIRDALERELKYAENSVQIISAFCKERTIERLNSLIPERVSDRNIMLRFRMDDIVKGVTDIEAARLCIDEGWNVYFRFDLHAKTYIVDDKRGIIGSANSTNKGLSFSNASNLEIATLVDMDDLDIQKIGRLYKGAIKVDSSLLDEMKAELDRADKTSSGRSLKWSDNIIDKFHPSVNTLFSFELPDSDSMTGYIPFLEDDFNGNNEEFKEAFRWSNAYCWLVDDVRQHGGEAYFGELTADLHDVLVSDPKPYRKDVKKMLANLLSIVEKLNMPELLIDRPNYSQRVRIVR